MLKRNEALGLELNRIHSMGASCFLQPFIYLHSAAALSHYAVIQSGFDVSVSTAKNRALWVLMKD